MSVYQRGNSWYIHIQIKGVRIQRKAGETKEGALLLQAMLRKEARLGKFGLQRHQITFHRAATEYLQHVKSTLAPLTYKMAYKAYYNYLFSFMELLFLGDVNDSLLLKIQGMMKKKGLSNRTVNIIIGTIRKVMNYSVKREYMEERKINYPMLRESKRLHASLSMAEYERLIGCIRDNLARKRVQFERLTGMRPKEIAYLSWKDIDMDNRVVRVHSTKTDESRVIPLSQKAMDILSGIPKVGPWVFSRGKNPILNIKNTLALASIKAGIGRNVTPNMLRHTFATHLLQEGVDIETVRVLLGQKSILTTQRYLHSQREQLRQAVEVLK